MQEIISLFMSLLLPQKVDTQPVRLDGSMRARLNNMRVRKPGYEPEAATRRNNLLSRMRAGDPMVRAERASSVVIKAKWIGNEEALLDSNFERSRAAIEQFSDTIRIPDIGTSLDVLLQPQN